MWVRLPKIQSPAPFRPMFIRFAQIDPDPECRLAEGMFQLLDDLPDLAPEDWRLAEIGRVRAWFADNLEKPDFLEKRIGRQGVRQGLCWFDETAGEHIEQARYLAWLLTDLGLPVEEIRSERPGLLLYDDGVQVVAVPDRETVIVRP